MRIGLARKKASTTAYQAFTLRCLLWRHAFWTCAYPLGIADVSLDDIIDVSSSCLQHWWLACYHFALRTDSNQIHACSWTKLKLFRRESTELMVRYFLSDAAVRTGSTAMEQVESC